METPAQPPANPAPVGSSAQCLCLLGRRQQQLGNLIIGQTQSFCDQPDRMNLEDVVLKCAKVISWTG